MHGVLPESHTGPLEDDQSERETSGRWAHATCVKGGYRDDDTIQPVNPADKNSIEETLTDLEMNKHKMHRTVFTEEDGPNEDENMTPASE